MGEIMKNVVNDNVRDLKLQVLVSTMNQHDHSLLDRMGIMSDAVVINQCDIDSKECFEYKGQRIIWINSTQRGVSRSRNMALENADSEIILLSDDDEKFYEGYKDEIIEAYNKVNYADVIVFNVNRIGWIREEKLFTDIKKIPYYKSYSSVHISFKRESIRKYGILFNINFGPGSGKYAHGEDSIFFMECHKNGLKMYTYPKILADVNCQKSSWFKGFDESYFYDVGAYLSVAFPKTKHLMKWYYYITCKGIASISRKNIIKCINEGIYGYRSFWSCEEYKWRD
jgi:glycosyltransferase involved in cell wall biosynthesis